MGKKRMMVKPVVAGGLFGWVVLELTPWQSFWDDRRRYGWRIAVGNLLIDLGLRPIDGGYK